MSKYGGLTNLLRNAVWRREEACWTHGRSEDRNLLHIFIVFCTRNCRAVEALPFILMINVTSPPCLMPKKKQYYWSSTVCSLYILHIELLLRLKSPARRSPRWRSSWVQPHEEAGVAIFKISKTDWWQVCFFRHTYDSLSRIRWSFVVGVKWTKHTVYSMVMMCTVPYSVRYRHYQHPSTVWSFLLRPSLQNGGQI
jgi:hypothetical protein